MMIMRKIYVLLTLCLLVASCKDRNIDVDYTYEPAQPKAGEMIRFTNTSSAGDEWQWSFGDVSTSTAKNPLKVYRRAGSYAVTLKVNNRSYLTCTKTIVVYDSVPSFYCATDSVEAWREMNIFAPVQFVASVYNPYGHTLRYAWSLPGLDSEDYVLLSDSMTMAELTLRIALPVDSQTVSLVVSDVTTGDVYHSSRTYHVADVAKKALVYRADGSILRQRIFGTPASPLYEQAYANDQLAAYDAALIAATDDTPCTMERRRYYHQDGVLYVSGLNGENVVRIDDDNVRFVTADRLQNRIYWAADEGVFSLPLIQSANNEFDRSMIDTINTLTGVDRIAIDQTAHLH